ncbi:MAG: fructose-6-phosphate aldolase [Alphaproteobacteria bacterium]|jgi:transaldolase|nr:fructose-6-phosphate aldolase [Alphaproteobacteria bacterium]MBT5389611.1 fructose-6-phosphate aldolase [Alphaproteobacteria bacterium]MBT5540175.1 fructose-6-phosphate aldolase [Alphaproteobacteria bacterium]MBT5654855.1 fructose-6-phosphate aldolase [Alphaproteobacteria bacterium]
MKFFLDTADVEEIKDLAQTGLVDGVTTNPSLVAKTGRDFKEILKEICAIISGPVSAEVTATDYDSMMKEGLHLAKIAPNIAIKVPLTMEGLRACRSFREKGILVNVTLCFSPSQALLAAKAGASFISPFIGRLDDIGQDGMELLASIREIYDNYPEIETEILAASIRHTRHVVESAELGIDIATIPPSILKKLVEHPLTDKGLDAFLKDWKKTNQSIVA